MNQVMLTLSETIQAIDEGKRLLLAGDEALLRQLPKGEWIAGTIPYFVGEEGGVFSRDRVFATELPPFATDVQARLYGVEELANMTADAPEYGVSFIIIPAGSPAHLSFAENAPSYRDSLLKPFIGWISGVALPELGTATPKVFNGATGEVSDNQAIVLHAALPRTKAVVIDIVNVFKQGAGDELVFDQTGFSAEWVTAAGKRVRLADYLAERKIDTKLPLVADSNGAMINTSFQSVDAATGKVLFYAPVFKDVKYRVAAPVGDYNSEFGKAVPVEVREPAFSCNCILNYLYGQLEGQKTGAFRGPVTFGEIAYQLLNQTLVYLDIKDL